MSLDLDKRQRAMLREMGIRLWQPQAVTAEVAGVVVAADTQKISVSTPTSAALPAPEAAVVLSSASNAPPSRRPPVESAPASAAPSNAANETAGNSAWSLGEARALYAQPAKPAADNGQPAVPGATARWLLLIETPPGTAEADPLAGDAGKLLDNMLRAAGLHQSASAVSVPLSRRVDAGTSAPLDAVLAELLKAEKPDVILIMGRLAAQALLQSTEPLGKLRGRTHQLAGVAAVVTYDAAYLLRSLPDKAKAWDDLCRAQHIAQQIKPA
jgi:uracil-DNA glycosylase family 4